MSRGFVFLRVVRVSTPLSLLGLSSGSLADNSEGTLNAGSTVTLLVVDVEVVAGGLIFFGDAPRGDSNTPDMCTPITIATTPKIRLTENEQKS
jgi:hypothetical protein